MAIIQYPPNTILLHGPTAVIVNDIPGSGEITPGMLVERFNASGVAKWRAQVTAAANAQRAIALNRPENNKGVDDVYADGDLIQVAILGPGDTAWCLLPAAAAAIVAGDGIESAGAGLLRKLAAGVSLFKSLANVDNSAGATTMRIKVEAM